MDGCSQLPPFAALRRRLKEALGAGAETGEAGGVVARVANWLLKFGGIVFSALGPVCFFQIPQVGEFNFFFKTVIRNRKN